MKKIIQLDDLFLMNYTCIYINCYYKVSNYNDRNNDFDIRSSEDTTNL